MGKFIIGSDKVRDCSERCGSTEGAPRRSIPQTGLGHCRQGMQTYKVPEINVQRWLVSSPVTTIEVLAISRLSVVAQLFASSFVQLSIEQKRWKTLGGHRGAQ